MTELACPFACEWEAHRKHEPHGLIQKTLDPPSAAAEGWAISHDLGLAQAQGDPPLGHRGRSDSGDLHVDGQVVADEIKVVGKMWYRQPVVGAAWRAKIKQRAGEGLRAASWLNVATTRLASPPCRI